MTPAERAIYHTLKVLACMNQVNLIGEEFYSLFGIEEKIEKEV